MENIKSREGVKENPVWDIVKLILAFFVVGIHTSAKTPSADVNFFVEEWLSRFAVPLFFCIAGYFLFSKLPSSAVLDRQSGKTVLHYSFRILRMYGIWTLIYLIPQGYTWLKSGVTMRDLLIYIEYAIVRGDSYVHLWYLSSLFTGVFLLRFLNRVLPLRAVFLISAMLYVFDLLWLPHEYLVQNFVDTHTAAASLKEFLNRYIGWPRNGTFFGFVFVTLGAYLAKKKAFPSKRVSAGLAVLFAGLSFLEVAWIYQMHGRKYCYCALQASLVPATYFLFCFLHSIQMQAKGGRYGFLRLVSTFIYCIHPLIQFILERLPIPMLRSFLKIPFAEWLLVYALGFAVSYLIVFLEKEKNLHFLKILH